MKYFLLALLFATAVHAQIAKPDQKTVDEMNPNQREFLNLPEEKRNEFIKLCSNAQDYFKSMRVFETLEALNQAEKIFSKSVELYNLRGSCYVELRVFDKAEMAFNKALELNPKDPSLMFNVAECKFVSRQWQASHDKFQELLKVLPDNLTTLSRVAEFKIYLCKKKLGLDKEASLMADKYDYHDDSPYYYFVRAAQAYDKKDAVEAEQWLARAQRIFLDPKILGPWHDTMMEYGYIKSFFGGELVPTD